MAQLERAVQDPREARQRQTGAVAADGADRPGHANDGHDRRRRPAQREKPVSGVLQDVHWRKLGTIRPDSNLDPSFRTAAFQNRSASAGRRTASASGVKAPVASWSASPANRTLGTPTERRAGQADVHRLHTRGARHPYKKKKK